LNDYKTLNHSKFLLIYHIIFVVKYRKKLLKKYGDEIKQLIFEISKKSDFDIQEMEVDKDHLHLMVTSVPKISPLQIVRKLKSNFGKKRPFGVMGIFVVLSGMLPSKP
jgi:putative transposase